MNKLEQFIVNLWKVVKADWLEYLIILAISTVCATLVALVICKHLKGVFGRNHYAFVAMLSARYLLTCAGLVFYKIIGKLNIKVSNIFLVSLLFELAFVCVWVLLWLFIIKTVLYIITRKRFTSVDLNNATVNTEIVEEKSDEALNKLCSVFTQKWITEHIAKDLTRSNTLLQHKQSYITKLTAELSEFCKKPALIAETYYKHCLDMWKND